MKVAVGDQEYKTSPTARMKPALMLLDSLAMPRRVARRLQIRFNGDCVIGCTLEPSVDIGLPLCYPKTTTTSGSSTAGQSCSTKRGSTRGKCRLLRVCHVRNIGCPGRCPSEKRQRFDRACPFASRRCGSGCRMDRTWFRRASRLVEAPWSCPDW